MKKKTILILVLVLLFSILLIDYSYLQEEEKIACWTSGNKYLKMTEENKLYYVAGLIDMLFRFTFYNNKTLYSVLSEKTNEMTAGQIRAIFDKYLEEHPEKWHMTASGLFYTATMEIVLDN